ncbi:MAG TPA: ABC transporter permease subunit [Stellaceae bacterium]|nr:ABC transporter permease subunit [Stellaceae bacterium]
MSSYFALIGFGPTGWGLQLLQASLMTLAVACAGFLFGLAFGAIGAWAKLSGSRIARAASDAYTTVLRGVPDLLVIYLFYFGGSAVITGLGRWLGEEGFIGLNSFLVGALAVGIVSGAYQTEALRGAYRMIPRGELEAARAVGMGRALMFHRIVIPQVLRFALPSMGNIWQAVLKESALISVTGLVELLRETHLAAGATRQPFTFYMTGAVIYLVLTTLSGVLFQGAERRTTRSVRLPPVAMR